jgi:hypothetical protein
MTATLIASSSFPLRFSEVANVRGDFGANELVNPKGVAFHPALNAALVTLTPNSQSGRVLILNAVNPDGSRTVFSPGYKPYRDVESMLAVVPESGPPVTAGFAAGDVFVNRGPHGQISRLSSSGTVLADVWVDLGSNGLWGGIAFDTAGSFGGQLVALDNDGKIFLVDPQKHATLLVDLAARIGARIRAEGVAVDPMSFGPRGGQIVVGVEGDNDEDPQSGKVYAVDGHGNPSLLADIGYTAEHIAFVPINGGTYYQAELSFERARENRLWSVSASQFLARAGFMLIINEMSGDLWEVSWDGAKYAQSLAGRVPGRWSSQGLGLQHTELEGGDFAVREPSLPSWHDWSPVPGGGTTDARPDACVDASGNLHLFVKGINDRHIYMQSMWGNTEAWTGWVELPPGGLTTHHSLGSALHEQNLHVFAVRDDGQIVHKRVFIGGGPLTNEPWTPVPGGLATNAAVTAAVGTGRLVLCAKSTDNQLHINELAVGGRSWSGWSLVPGGDHTNAGPALVGFQDELYLFIKGLTSDKVLVKARSPEGSSWTQLAELPGTGRTDASVAAVSSNNQCYVFIKGLHGAPHVNVASDSGTWSGWSRLPNPGTTNAALATAAIGSRVYLFAKGVNDNALYVRRNA